MKKIYHLFTLAFITTSLSAQISEGGLPRSADLHLKSASSSAPLELKKLKIDKEMAHDLEHGIKNRYAVYEEYNIDIRKEGSETVIDEGKIWKYKIQSKNTYSIALFFSKYVLPEGAELFIYNEDLSSVFGAFTSKNNKEYGSLAVADFPGQELTIEYFEPSSASFEGTLILGQVGQSYRPVFDIGLKSTELDHVNINCEPGSRHKMEKQSVAKITFQIDNSGYLCSGALINNSNNDGTPYFLTANHCLSTNAAANTLVATFNFESASCGGFASSGNTLSGSNLVVTSQASDVTLLRLIETPPSDYQPYYAGWNSVDDDSVDYVVGIHHPAGIDKKIYVDYDKVFSSPQRFSIDGEYTAPPHFYWYTEPEVGFTEGGSSGSPLFDSTKKIIGQLTGGGEDFSWDIYGKISRSWPVLKASLDPGNKTDGKLDGYYPADQDPIASFYADFNKVCKDEPVQLKDASAFDVDTYNWNFIPNTVTYISGNSNSENPVVSFNENASYTITLTVSNDSGSSTSSKPNYIEAKNSIDVNIQITSESIMCPKDFDQLRLIASGASSYEWFISDTNNYTVIDSNQINQSVIDIYRNGLADIVTNTEFIAKVVGRHGSCSDSAEIKIRFKAPPHDSVHQALLIEPGSYGPFSNRCATVEDNEPVPPGGNCESQQNWCDCEVSDTILDNSIWFKFIAPESGIISINAPGFDNQLALYEAESADDILTNNFTLIAANDDYFGEEKDYSALISGAAVAPGKLHWIQVDGSACGAEGSFNLELYDFKFISISNTQNHIEEDNLVSLFPNPVKTKTVYFTTNKSGETFINIYTLQGSLITNSNVGFVSKGQEYKLALPVNLAPGMYLIKTEVDGITDYQQLIVQ